MTTNMKQATYYPQKLYTNSQPQPKNIETHKNSLNFILSTPFYLKTHVQKKTISKCPEIFVQQPPTLQIMEKPPPKERPTHDGENTRFVGELEKFQGNCNQILPGTPAAA